MNEPARLAFQDQQKAWFRDHAQGCLLIFDEYVRAGFTPDHAMELLHRFLDGVEVRCDAST